MVELHGPELEAACVKRDALIDRLLATRDYRAGTSGRDGLLRYLIGHGHGNPNGIPTQLRHAQEDVLDLMANEVDPWRA